MTAAEWLDSLSPWPRDGFGLERMRELMAEPLSEARRGEARLALASV